MPENSKKHQQKSKNDPKGQRKPRQRQSTAAEKKVEERTEETRVPHTVPVPVQAKPVYEDPGPEFYKNLKRETDEILKITEEANSKYKKKEIQSNWAKYEMPIESYEEIDEQEDLGADYEKLAQVPLSIGGHFQFKHEKSWDVDTAPSLYDKYFEINMDNLATAICTIPFYERNNIDQSLFTESDKLTMDNRSIKYKQRYYNDKSYSTSELEAQEKILKNLKEKLSDTDDGQEINVTECISEEKDISFDNLSNVSDQFILVESKETDTKISSEQTINQNSTVTPEKVVDVTKEVKNIMVSEENRNFINLPTLDSGHENQVEVVENIIETPIFNERKHQNVILESENNPVGIKEITSQKVYKVIDDIDNVLLDHVKEEIVPGNKVEELNINAKKAELSKATVSPESVPKNPVIESPEDLEKWLDDFLEG